MFPGLPDAQGQVRFMVEWVLVLFISCRGNPAKRLLTLSADKGRRGAASSCRKPPFFKAFGILICLFILPRSRGRCQRREQNGCAIRPKIRRNYCSTTRIQDSPCWRSCEQIGPVCVAERPASRVRQIWRPFVVGISSIRLTALANPPEDCLARAAA